MLTSEPSLRQRVERVIAETPIVDPHTHIRCDRPAAPDLAALLDYHWVRTELRSVGMPAADSDPALPPDERVRRAIPYLRRMRNTTTAWTLYRVFRDLYDFHDPDLDDQNYRGLLDKVAECGRDPAWPAHVLRDRANVRTAVTSLGNRGADPSAGPPGMLFMLDAHYLFCPGVATDLDPFFTGRTDKAGYYDALAAVVGDSPAAPDRLAAGLRDWLDRTVTGPVRFSNTFLPTGQRFTVPDPGAARAALERAAAGNPLTDREIDALVCLVTWEVLGWHHDRRKTLQIAVGAEYFICDGKSVPRYDPTWTGEMARAFHHFGGARFDLMVASANHSQETAVLARQFPNVSVSGYWWHNFVPAAIEAIATQRVQTTPMTKFTGFLCDAYYVEWTYGKLQVVKKALVAAFAKLIADGFFDEEEVPPVLRQILHDTPRDLYDLAPR